MLEAGALKLLQQETLDQTELATLHSALPLAAANALAPNVAMSVLKRPMSGTEKAT